MPWSKAYSSLYTPSLYTSLCVFVHKRRSDLSALSLLKQVLRQVQEKPILTPTGYVTVYVPGRRLASSRCMLLDLS